MANRIRGIRQKIPPGTVLARKGNGSGPPVPVKVAELIRTSGGAIASIVSSMSNLDNYSDVQGSILYRDADGWVALGPGTSGQILETLGAAANPAWAAISAILDTISSTRGSILYRGAALWLALAPGTSGNVLTTNGAGADPTWAAGGGGAAASPFVHVPPSTSFFAASFAARGNLYTAQMNAAVYNVGALLTTVNSGTYKIGIAPYDTVNNKVTSAPTYGSVYTEGGGTGGANRWVTGAFNGFALTAGTTYIIFIVRTDATTTTSMTVNTFAEAIASPGIYHATTSGSVHIANQAPGTGDVWTTEGGFYTFQFSYTMTF